MSEKRISLIVVVLEYDLRQTSEEFDTKLVNSTMHQPIAFGGSVSCQARSFTWPVYDMVHGFSLVQCIRKFMTAHGFREMESGPPGHRHPGFMEFHAYEAPARSMIVDESDIPEAVIDADQISKGISTTLERIAKKVNQV